MNNVGFFTHPIEICVPSDRRVSKIKQSDVLCYRTKRNDFYLTFRSIVYAAKISILSSDHNWFAIDNSYVAWIHSILAATRMR